MSSYEKQLINRCSNGIADYAVNVYKFSLSVIGFTCRVASDLAEHGLRRLELKNRSAEPYLRGKKQITEPPVGGPIFVTRAKHPHDRSDKTLPEWVPVESPATVRDRGDT